MRDAEGSVEHEAQNPNFREYVAEQFGIAPFIHHLGIQLVDFGPGWCETSMQIRPEHLQHHGLFHAGVVATIADHSAGMASGTLCPQDKAVLTAEYKINLLRPGVGESIRCRAEVLKPGKTLTIVESKVWAIKDGSEKLIAKMMATMALV